MFLWRCKKLAKCPTWNISLLNRIFSGGACAPPFCAVGRLSAHFKRLIGLRKRCQSGVGRFLKVLGCANLTPIRRTGKQKPAELQRVLCVDLGRKFKLNSLRLVPYSKAHQKNSPFEVCGRRRVFIMSLVLFGMIFAVFLYKKYNR